MVMSLTNGGAPTALRPDRRTARVSAPAAMPNGRPDPPPRETPPRIAPAAAGAMTSDNPAGEAEDADNERIDLDAGGHSGAAVTADGHDVAAETRPRKHRRRAAEENQSDDAANGEDAADPLIKQQRDAEIVVG